MKRCLATVLMFLSMSSAVLAQGQDEPVDKETEFLHTNESGEEIFGPGYMPTSPQDKGLPYLIGQPNAGVEIPENMLTLPQDAFRQESLIQSLPAEGLRKRFLPGVPLRQEFDRTIELQNFTPEPSLKAAPLAARKARRRGGKLSTMWAHFVHVGQGDGAILEFPCQVAVIDVGGQYRQMDGGKVFVEYLEKFFASRPHLNRTIDVVFLTHPHADHINGTRQLLDKNGKGPFKIKSVVDNGQTGKKSLLLRQTQFRKRARANGAKYSAIELADQVTATGVTNAAIDPISCPDIDPVITAFWGGANELVSKVEGYTDPNNHSVIIRVDFGDASFLFTGDLEDVGEKKLRKSFKKNLSLFDVDVYQVSHHGADEDTSNKLMGIMTPKIAVISMGDTSKRGSATAWDHGHPRIGTVKILQDTPVVVSKFRKTAVKFPAARKQEVDYDLIDIKRAIYGTGWEGTIIIKATSDGKYEIETTGLN